MKAVNHLVKPAPNSGLFGCRHGPSGKKLEASAESGKEVNAGTRTGIGAHRASSVVLTGGSRVYSRALQVNILQLHTPPILLQESGKLSPGYSAIFNGCHSTVARACEVCRGSADSRREKRERGRRNQFWHPHEGAKAP